TVHEVDDAERRPAPDADLSAEPLRAIDPDIVPVHRIAPSSLDLRGTPHARDHRRAQHILPRRAPVRRRPPHGVERGLAGGAVTLADHLLVAVGLLLHPLDRHRAPLPGVALIP